MAGMNVVFEAFANRWNQGGLQTTISVLTEAEPREKTARPYAFLKPVANGVKFRTNKGRYEKVLFDLEMAFDNFEDVDAPATAVIDLFDEEPLQLPGNVYQAINIRQNGDIQHMMEDQYQRVIIPFEATISRGRFRGG